MFIELFNIFSILVVGISLVVILACYFLFKKYGFQFYLYLALIFFPGIVNLSLLYIKFNHQLLLDVKWNYFSGLLNGPLLLFFVRSLAVSKRKFTLKDTLHFLPFIIGYLIAYVSLSLNINISKQELFVFKYISVISWLIYIGYSLLILVESKKILLENRSTIEIEIYAFVKAILLLVLSVIVIDSISIFIVQLDIDSDYIYLFEIGGLFLYYVLLNFVLFRLILKPLNGIQITKREIQISNNKIDKYKKSPLNQDEKLLIKEKLITIMEGEMLWNNPELNIEIVSQHLNQNSRFVSQVINELFEMNFYDFVNHYRVKNAIKRIEVPKDEKETISEIMYEVGFNSRSSFIAAFKKITKMTPTEYKNNLNV